MSRGRVRQVHFRCRRKERRSRAVGFLRKTRHHGSKEFATVAMATKVHPDPRVESFRKAVDTLLTTG